jgi:DNA-binding transcriptional LysR family regulator
MAEVGSGEHGQVLLSTPGDLMAPVRRPEGSSVPGFERWRSRPGVEFRHLEALMAVAREGSFRRAADSLGYVQSAISAQIADLERVVGTQLVERSSRSAGATLTRAGEVVLTHAADIVAQFDAARTDVLSLADGADAVVRIGVPDGVGACRLPEILRAFWDRFPTGRVVIRETDDDEQNFECVASGELELMITELPLPTGPFAYTPLERDAYVLLVAADSPLSKLAKPPDADQLAALPLLLPSAKRRRDYLSEWLSENGIECRRWLYARSTAALQALVSAGEGPAIVPAIAVDWDDPSTVAIEAPGLLPGRSIVLVRHRGREYSQTVQGFMRIAESVFKAEQLPLSIGEGCFRRPSPGHPRGV